MDLRVFITLFLVLTYISKYKRTPKKFNCYLGASSGLAIKRCDVSSILDPLGGGLIPGL